MKLVMVYNANEGLFNAVTDSVHKIVSPSTYECRLCLFTYGVRNMRRTWKRFLESLHHPVVFFHRNEFWREYNRRDIDLPAILAETDQGLNVLVSAEEINDCSSLEDLMSRLSKALEGSAVKGAPVSDLTQ